MRELLLPQEIFPRECLTKFDKYVCRFMTQIENLTKQLQFSK